MNTYHYRYLSLLRCSNQYFNSIVVFCGSLKTFACFFFSFHFTRYNKLFKNNRHSIASLLCISHVHVFCFLHFIFGVIYLNNMSRSSCCSSAPFATTLQWGHDDPVWDHRNNSRTTRCGSLTKTREAQMDSNNKVHFHKNIPNNDD